MVATKEIKVDLFDSERRDNQRFVNLLNKIKLDRLIESYNEGKGEKSFSELLEELLESR